jgi:uncharacterized protein (TIGR02118 family)
MIFLVHFSGRRLNSSVSRANSAEHTRLIASESTAAPSRFVQENPVIKVSVLYPNGPDTRFDMAYYLEHHIPLADRLFGAHPGYRGVVVERGLAGAIPGADAPFVALCHFSFDSLGEFMAAFEPHTAELQGDIPNYSNIAPIIQISEVVMPS